ncbi:hypothetical protein ABT267_50685, partial [Nonomuraea sp. NPDC001023]
MSPILARIRGIEPTLTATHRRIAETILAEPATVAASTIGELAERCGTSLTTVTRFCRQLGLAGYPELRLALAAELGRNDAAPREQGLIAFSPDDPASLVLRSLLARRPSPAEWVPLGHPAYLRQQAELSLRRLRV